MSLSNLVKTPLDDSDSENGSDVVSAADHGVSVCDTFSPSRATLSRVHYTSARVPFAPVREQDVRKYIEKTLEYYDLDEESRQANKELYFSGAQPMQDICKEHYDSLIASPAWSERTRALFTAIQFSEALTYSELGNDDGTKREGPDATVQVDLYRNGKSNEVCKKNCQSVHVVRNHVLDWDQERQLFFFMQNRPTSADVDCDDDGGWSVTVADPGTEDEYRQRLHDASHLADGTVVPVTVRRLEGGKCVTEQVRPSESFVIEKATQLTLVQSLYEIFSWFIRIQGQPLADWRKTTNKQDFLTIESQNFMRKHSLSLKLITLNLPKHTETTTKSTARKPKKMTAFENYWQAKKQEIPAKIKKDLMEEWKGLPAQVKDQYRANPINAVLKRPADVNTEEMDAEEMDAYSPPPKKPRAEPSPTPSPPDSPELVQPASPVVLEPCVLSPKSVKPTKAVKAAKTGKASKTDKPLKSDKVEAKSSKKQLAKLLLYQVFEYNMNTAIDSGAFKQDNPFDDITSQALELPEGERVAHAHSEIVKKISMASAETKEAWTASFRIFNAMFGPVNPPSKPAATNFIM
jgi:hypothetical protein